jgi:protein CrcB
MARATWIAEGETLRADAGAAGATAFIARTLDPAWRIALTVGFCGGFTTFSTFSAELVAMAQEGRVLRAAAYVLASLLLGVTATLVGLAVGDRLLTTLRS